MKNTLALGVRSYAVLVLFAPGLVEALRAQDQPLPAAPATLTAPETEPAPAFPGAPQALPADHFTALRSQSPFRRSLNLAETYVLKAVTRIGDSSVATIHNKDTKQTFTVTTAGEASPGTGAEMLKLVEVAGVTETGTTAVKIDVAGELAELKYSLEQITPPTKNPIGNGMLGKGGQGGGERDGQRRGPTPEEMDRYKKLSPENQEKLRGYIRNVMEKYPDMPREERGAMIRGALMRLSDGHDVNIQPRQEGGNNAGGGGSGERRREGGGGGGGDRERGRERGDRR